MKVVGLMKVRNEQWVLGLSLPAALMVCDEVVILDHGSTDETGLIIDRAARAHPGRIQTLAWSNPAWTEAAICQRLLETGRARGGTHFYAIDADEVLSGNLIGEIRGWLAGLQPAESLWLPWPAMWRSLDCYRDDESVWSGAFMLAAFCDSPQVAYASAAGGYDIHSRAPEALMRKQQRRPGDKKLGGLMHLQFANRRRLRAKHAWYKMIEVVRWPGRSTVDQINHKYNRAMDETDLKTVQVPASWWAPYAELRAGVRVEDEPWHERECREMWKTHGAQKFAGLELWGVPQGSAYEHGQAGQVLKKKGRADAA